MKKAARRQALNYRLAVLGIVVFTIVMIGIFGLRSAAKAEASETPCTKCFTCVEIHEGDTLTSIAQTYMDDHYSDTADYIEEVKSMNGLKSDTIHAGEHLTVPYYVEDAEI